MQTAEDLRRVARECAEDLAADGVVYGEVRFAPEQHIEARADPGAGGRGGPDGLAEGEGRGCRGAGHRSWCARCSPRCARPTVAGRSPSAGVAYRDSGVVGFDIAGAEDGYPPTRHLDAFEYLRRENAHFTIHAGEAFGLPCIWEAVQRCGAERLGHGVRIIDDISLGPDGKPNWATWPPTSGTTGSRWRCARVQRADRRCGLDRRAPDRSAAQLWFRVTVNTDNRLMAGHHVAGDALLCEAFGYTLDDVPGSPSTRPRARSSRSTSGSRLIKEVIKPGFAALGATG